MSALLASVAAFALLPLAAQIGACSTGAIGIEACRSIEAERCKLAPLCASVKGHPKIKTTLQVNNCIDYYHDHCLVGIEDATIKGGDPAKPTYEACVSALSATGACQSNGAATMADCPGAAVDNAALTPCAVIGAPEHLTACNFIETPTTATGSSTASTGTGAGGTGGAGGSG